MDILKSVLGIGNSIGGFFNKKKKDLEDAFQQFSQPKPQPVQQQRQQMPQLSFNRPTPTPTPQPPKINVAPPVLSFNQPKPTVTPPPRPTVPVQPQPNPLQQFFKNTAQKAADAAGTFAKTVVKELPSTKFGTAIGKTIVRPFDAINQASMNNTDLEEARKMTDLAIKLSAQGNKEGAAKLFQRSRELSQGATQQAQQFGQENKKLQGDVVKNGVGTILSIFGAGYTVANPLLPAIGAGIGGVMNKVQGKSFFEGAGKGLADSLPMSGVMQFTSPAINIAAPKIASYIKNPFFQSVAERGLVGTGNILENRIINAASGNKSDLSQDVFAFTLGALAHSPGKVQIKGWAELPEATKTSVIRIANQAGLDTTPTSWAGDINWDQTPKFLDDLRHSVKQDGVVSTIGKGLDAIAENATMGLSVKAKGGTDAILAAEEAKNAPKTEIGTLKGPAGTKANKSVITEALKSSTSQEEAIKKFEVSMGEAQKRFDELKSTAPQEAIDRLKRVRAAVNQSMYEVAGVDPKNGKYEAKVFGESFNNPDVAPLLEKMQGTIKSIDDTLAANGSGVGANAPLTGIDQTIQTLRDQKMGVQPQGNETIRLMDTPASELSLEDKLKKIAIEKSAQRGASEIKTEQTPAAATTRKTAEQIQQEVQAGTYQPRTKRALAPEKPVLTTADLPGQPKPPVIKQRGFVSSVQDAKNISDATKANVTGDYTVKTNPELMGEAQALLQEGASIDFKNTKNLDQKVAATIKSALATQKEDPQAAANLFNNLSEQGTNIARGLQAYTMLDKMTPEAIALSAAGKIKKYNMTARIKIPELSGENVQMISDAVAKIDGLTGREKNLAINDLATTINEMIPSSAVDKAITLWKAGLLTSLRTHERNLVGNTIMIGSEAAKDIPATFFDKIMALKTGKRTLTPTLQGMVGGAKKGLQAAKDIVQTGIDQEEDISKFDVQKINWGKNPVEQALKKYTDVVFRTLGGEDKPFWNAAFARSLYDQAGAEAINAGNQGDKAFIQNLVKTPSEDMLKIATKDANDATFHNKNVLNTVANAVKRAAKDPRLGWGADVGKIVTEVLMPFTGVPSAIAGKTIAYSPIGLLKGAVNMGRVMLTDVPELQRQAAQELGRGVMGTGLYGLGAYLMSKGLMTGQPKDTKEAALWATQNKQANSVLVGGKWQSIGSIGPQNLAMLAGAKLQEEMGKPGGGDFGAYAGGLAKDQLSQTFLAGVQGPLNAVTDPARYGKSYVGNTASSFIPNIVKDTSKAFDPAARENNTVADYVKSGIPGVRNTLLPKRDALGNVIPQEPTGLGAFFDLFNSKTPVDNTVVNELDRLSQTGNDAIPSKINANQSILKQKVKLTFEQLNGLEKGVGEALKPQLESLLQSSTYQNLDDEHKAKSISDLVSNVRTKYKNLNATDILAGPSATGSPQIKVPNEIPAQVEAKTYSYVDPQGNYKTIDVGKVAGMPETTRYDKTLKQKAAFTLVDDILDNLPKENQAEALKSIGMDENSAQYYNVARQADDAKYSYILDKIDTLGGDRQAMLGVLVNGRAPINNKMVVSNAVVDDLYNAGYISKSEATELKKIKLDSNGKVTKASAGSGTGGLTKSKLDTMINKAKAYGKQFAIGTPPQIDTNISSTASKTAKQATTPKSTLSADFFAGKIPTGTKITIPKIEDLITNTKKVPTMNIAKARALVAKAGSGGTGGASMKLSQSFFRG